MTNSRREFLMVMTGLPLFLAGGYGVSGAQSAAPKNEPAQPEKVFVLTEGKTAIAEVSFPDPITDLTGGLPVRIEPASFGGEQLNEPQPLFFYPGKDARSFRTLLTAPLDVVAGDYTAHLVGKYEATEVRRSLKCTIRRGVYHETAITVDQSFSKPTTDMIKRMQSEFEVMVEIYQRRTPRRWSAAFIPPVAGPDRDNYGDKRTYNLTKHSRHGGLDYRAAIGTPIKAINDGVVVLSGEQWVSGQTICIDHGGGVFSKYLHLSQRKVKVDDVVKAGDLIGLSGRSGSQKPSPHLHLNVVVNRVPVDPKDFMRTASELLALETQDRAGRG